MCLGFSSLDFLSGFSFGKLGVGCNLCSNYFFLDDFNTLLGVFSHLCRTALNILNSEFTVAVHVKDRVRFLFGNRRFFSNILNNSVSGFIIGFCIMFVHLFLPIWIFLDFYFPKEVDGIVTNLNQGLDSLARKRWQFAVIVDQLETNDTVFSRINCGRNQCWFILFTVCFKQFI